MKIYQILEAIVKTDVKPEQTFHGTFYPKQFDKMRPSEFSVVAQSKTDPHMVKKHNHRPMDPDARRRFPVDGFNYYVNQLIDLDVTDNIHFPKIYAVKKINDQSHQFIHTYDTEKLETLNSMSRDELIKLCIESFGEDEDIETYNDSMLEYIIAGKIAYSLENNDYGDIVSDELKEALRIIKQIAKSGIKTRYRYKLDIHEGNIMVRRTPYGPQLVINDPIA